MRLPLLPCRIATFSVFYPCRMKFSELGLSEALQQSIIQAGYQKPTPIQEQAIPRILAGGDLIASAQTGTGKTAAFALPILQRLSQKNYNKVRPIRALVITPTRELASQVGASFKVLGSGLMPKLRCIEVFGGVKVEGQEHKLKLGCDVLVGTPGRLLDLISQGIVRLALIEIVVLDEGDRLLEMGFLPDIRNICSQIPAASQRLMFSTTGVKLQEYKPNYQVKINLKHGIYIIKVENKTTKIILC